MPRAAACHPMRDQQVYTGTPAKSLPRRPCYPPRHGAAPNRRFSSVQDHIYYVA